MLDFISATLNLIIPFIVHGLPAVFIAMGIDSNSLSDLTFANIVVIKFSS